jgi:hypothetical protein
MHLLPTTHPPSKGTTLHLSAGWQEKGMTVTFFSGRRHFGPVPTFRSVGVCSFIAVKAVFRAARSNIGLVVPQMRTRHRSCIRKPLRNTRWLPSIQPAVIELQIQSGECCDFLGR